jgi:aminoglycoside/choline kinase family phosphotransferase
MAEREALIESFLAAKGWDGAQRAALAGDASFRRYERLALGDRGAVLMDAPPPEENVDAFVAVARHLKSLGFSAPDIFAKDRENGLLLIEDLGDDTFTRTLDQAIPEDGAETGLYELAVDVLIALHEIAPENVFPPGIEPYDDEKLLQEAFLLTDWTLPAVFGEKPAKEIRDAYRDAWLRVFPIVHRQPETLVLRDYHVDNLLTLGGREGVARCGLLDFQDAVRGPAAYDLMSLLEDARRDIGPDLYQAMLARYYAAFADLDRESFEAAFAVLAAQRHAKVIGIFTRLCVRDGKPRYLDHIPRVWRLLETALENPELSPVAQWFDAHVPADKRGVPPCPSAVT